MRCNRFDNECRGTTVFFNADASLDRIVVYEYWAEAAGEPLLEKFTGKASEQYVEVMLYV